MKINNMIESINEEDLNISKIQMKIKNMHQNYVIYLTKFFILM